MYLVLTKFIYSIFDIVHILYISYRKKFIYVRVADYGSKNLDTNLKAYSQYALIRLSNSIKHEFHPRCSNFLNRVDRNCVFRDVNIVFRE